FKVSAAPFHFWSPDGWYGKSSPKILTSCIRGKLPNSGKALELKIPSHNRKVIGGWTNPSCTVTSLKTFEKIGGNRGSKLVTGLSLYFFIFITLIIYLSVVHFHFLLYLNYSLLTILYLSNFYFYHRLRLKKKELCNCSFFFTQPSNLRLDLLFFNIS
uniref:hypothetical protein n=1 Tax=Exserohilum turcicum TaxID=93612 RepID=UPI002000F87E